MVFVPVYLQDLLLIKLHLLHRKKYLNCWNFLIVRKCRSFYGCESSANVKWKFDPHLELRAEVQAALAEVKAFGSIGNTFIHADAEGKVGVGVATGEAKAVINKEEISLKAEGSVAALRGEVKGSFTIFGITIEATGSGEVGALGGGVEFSSKSGELPLEEKQV